MTFALSLLFSSSDPQLPCSPQPQARTLLSLVNARACSLPTAIFSTGPMSDGASCWWSSLPQLMRDPSSFSRMTLPQLAPASFQPFRSEGALDLIPNLSDPNTRNSPVWGGPRRRVNSFPQRAFTTGKGQDTNLGEDTAGDGSGPSWPLRPAPQP